MVARVRHVNRARAIDRHPPRRGKLRGRARAIGVTGNTRARERRHHATRRDFSNRVIAGVRHVNIAGGIRRHAARRREERRRINAIGEAHVAATGERRHATRCRDPADPMVGRVGDEGIAAPIKGHTAREIEFHALPGPVPEHAAGQR